MARFTASFEGQPDGTVATTGNTGYDVVTLASSTIEFDTAWSAAGSSSLRVATVAANGPFIAEQSGPSGTTVWRRTYVRPAVLPAANENILRFLDGANTIMATVRITPTGTIGVLRAAGTLVGTSSHALAAGDPIRIEQKIVASNAAAGELTVTLFYGANLNGTTPDETISATGTSTGSNGPVARYRLGFLTGGANGDVNFDEDVVDDTGPIGPVGGGGAPLWTPPVISPYAGIF